METVQFYTEMKRTITLSVHMHVLMSQNKLLYILSYSKENILIMHLRRLISDSLAARIDNNVHRDRTQDIYFQA